MLYIQNIENEIAADVILPEITEYINEVLAYPFMEDGLDVIETVAERLAKYDTLVVIGTGGSCIGAKTLTSLANADIHYANSLDSHTVAETLAKLDLSKTGFLCVTKSGTTSETIALTLFYMNAVKEQLGADAIAEHFIFITTPTPSPFRKLGEKYGIITLDHDENLGGRFSVFSLVGLIPALWAGLDIAAIRSGAMSMLYEIEKNGVKAKAIQGALWQYEYIKKGYNASVVMPYVDRLATFTLWYRQIWAESVGKDGKGSTPVNSIGTFDQHSQLQLYLDGAKDKVFTLFKLDDGKTEIPNMLDDEDISYIQNSTLEQLNNAHYTATATTLKNAGCSVREMFFSSLDEENIGALLMHFMVETIVVARLMKVNPFDQPAVEDGKVLVRKFLK